MKILIDTQVFIWLINGDSRLGPLTAQALKDTSNQVLISYLSFFEMTIKASIGKLTFDASVVDDLPDMGIELLMPDQKLLRDYSIYNPSNKDPFDNAIITIAKSEKCTLATSDEKILGLPVKTLTVLDARK